MANIYIDPNAMQPQVVNTDGYTGVVPPSITPQDVLKHEVDMAKIEQAKAKADGALAKAKSKQEEGILGKNIDFSVSINPLDAVLQALPGGAVASNLIKAAEASNSAPSTDGYSINANGEVVNSHGVILPRNTPRTERIKQALLGANNSEEQVQPQGDGYFSNTNTNDLMPHFGDANAKFGVNNESALVQAKPQVTSTKQPPKTTELQDAGETNLDRIVKSLDPQGNGSGTIRTEDIEDIYNEAQASLLDKQEKLGKQFNDLGGTAGLSRMADDILQNKSVEQIVKDRLDAMGKLSGAEASSDNVMSSISHLIYKTAQDNNLHPAMAAELVFQSLDGENGWKHWGRFDDTDVTSNTALLEDDLTAKIKAVSGRKQPLDAAFRQMLKLRQLQNNVDNYKKQIDGGTANLLGAESFLANRPSDSAGYERFMDKYANMLNQHRNLAYQYASVAKALRDYKVE